MLEQEIASIIKFILTATDNPNPYYYNVPQDFLVPAVYFQQPEINSRGDTLKTYALEFSWFVKFFHKDTQSAHALAYATLTALQYKKNVVPIIDETGLLNGKGFRIKDPSIKAINDGVAQITLNWDSPRPYFEESYEKMMVYNSNINVKTVYESVVNNIELEVNYE